MSGDLVGPLFITKSTCPGEDNLLHLAGLLDQPASECGGDLVQEGDDEAHGVPSGATSSRSHRKGYWVVS